MQWSTVYVEQGIKIITFPITDVNRVFSSVIKLVCSIEIHARPDLRDRWVAVLRELRAERAVEEAQAENLISAERRHAEAEAANERRHTQLLRPHWILWATLVVASATLVVGILTWLFPRLPR